MQRLYKASEEGDVETLKTLIQNPAVDVNKEHKVRDDYRTPVYIAAWKDHPKCIEVLIAAKADLNIANNVSGRG